MSGMEALFILVTMCAVGLGLVVFLTLTFGFLSFIFGRSTGLGGVNSTSFFFTTVKTTSVPANRKRPAWIKMLSTTARDVPLGTFWFCRFIAPLFG